MATTNGLCRCGCAQKTNLDRSGKPRRFLRGHHRRGTGTGWWEGGYLYISVNGKKVAYHRHVWQQHHGPIPPGHIIHHIDGDKTNNDIANLACMSLAEHTRLHRTGTTYRQWTPEQMQRAIALNRAGMSQINAANAAGVPHSTLRRHLKRLDQRRTPQQTRMLRERGLAPDLDG